MARTSGMKWIIGYKLAKAPLMLVLAIWLTFRGPAALHVAVVLAHELADAGARWARLAQWLAVHVTARSVEVAAAVAWLDAALTALEGVLLLTGRTWGEWIVLLGMAALLPLEIESLVRRPGSLKALTLIVNATIVGYLAWRRSRHAAASR